MDLPDTKLSRIGAESARHVAAAAASCAVTQDHIRQSQDAIDRSFELLRRCQGLAPSQ